MVLIVDQGNSKTRFCVYHQGELQFMTGGGETETLCTPEMLRWLFQNLPKLGAGPLLPLDGAAISSVVPDRRDVLRDAIREHLQLEPQLVGQELQPWFPVRYTPRQSVGADRLANAAGALARYGAPVIVVDCGTATNIDVVAPDGAFIGGAILPGIQATRDALYRAAPHLPEVEITVPARVIGGSSQECLQSGLYYGAICQLEGLVRRTRDELGVDAPVIGTGGWWELLQEQPWVDHVYPMLTLDGIYEIWEANQGRIRNHNP